MRLTLALIALLFCIPGRADLLFNEQGYRINNYRRATPNTAPAGQLLSTSQLQHLMQSSNPLLIDVQAITVRPETEEFGFAWLPGRPRWHIQGSSWLPNVGYGELDRRMTHYFRSNLERLTEGDSSAAIVFYCVVDCWMSWNAVRRAAAWGYDNIYWYPHGSDGWAAAGLELVEGTPYPLQPASSAAFFSTYEKLDLELVAEQARESGREILLFFETEHCPFCLRMKKTVLINPSVIDRLQDGFIALAINIESNGMIRDADGNAVTERQFSSSEFRIVRTPTLVFVDPDFNLLHKHSGLIATAEEMKKLFQFVATRAYDIESWQQFKGK